MKNPIFIRLMLVTFGLSALVACSSLPPQEGRAQEYALGASADTDLGRVLSPLEDANPDKSGFYALTDGLNAFGTRLVLMNEAERSLDLQYYIWHNDLTGRVMFHQVLAAADRGVRVRLLLDDLDTAGKDETLRALDAHENIEVRLFNPFASRGSRIGDFVGDTSRINRRMHNKTLTADNEASIFGGRNIGDEYFDAAEDVGFNDLDMLAVGPVVREISSQFDLYWNSLQVYPLSIFYPEPASQVEQDQFRQDLDDFMSDILDTRYAVALRRLGEETEKNVADVDYSWGEWKLVFDLPSKVTADDVDKDTHLAPTLFEAMNNAHSELLIVSPYFVPGPKFTEFLVEKASTETDVRILTNSLAANDVSLVHSGYMRYREDLVAGGVELWEFKTTGDPKEKKQKRETGAWTGSSRASLHGKFLAFDHQYVFVGSFNLDARSVALNTELGVFFESERYATLISEGFRDNAIDRAYKLSLDNSGDLWWTTTVDGELISVDTEPDTGFWKRARTRFMSWFVPESQL